MSSLVPCSCLVPLLYSVRFLMIDLFFFRYDFKGVIDYVFFTDNRMNPLGVLGPLDKQWFKENKVVGCPHPHIPSDHFSLLVEFELPATGTARSQPSSRR